MGTKIRVLHVLDILTNNSGTSNVVMNYVRQSYYSDYAIDVVVYRESDANLIKEIESFGGQVFKLSDIKASSFLKFHREFANVILNNRYMIVHGHLANSVFLYMSAAKKNNVPVRIIHSHSTANSSNLLKRFRNNILNNFIPCYCNYYLACSDKAGQNLFYRHTYMENVKILPNGIDVLKYKYDEKVRRKLREQYDLKDNFVIGHVGRFESEKNHFFLINTFYEYKKYSDKSKLILIGDGSRFGCIKELIEEKGLTEDVLTLGVTDNVNEFYQLFDCLWLPSLFEGFGIVALEAQCSGLQCIVSENVPNDVMLTPHIEVAELNNIGKWIFKTQRIENSELVRTDYSSLLKTLGCDVREQGQRLFKLYDKCLSEGNK